MNPEETSGNTVTNDIQCGLQSYGCIDWFSRDQSLQHYVTKKHRKAMNKFLDSKETDYESAVDDRAINPTEDDEPLSPAAITINNQPLFIKRLTDFMVEMDQQLKPTCTVSNTSPNLNLIYTDTSNSVPRNLIQQMDRDANRGLNLQLHRDESRLNQNVQSDLSKRFTDPALAADHGNHRVEHNQDSASAGLQSTIEFYKHSNGILQTELDEKHVSTDGSLVWRIDNISNKIDDTITRTRPPYIDSPVFQTSMHGHRLRGRLYLNGKNDPKFVTFSIHLDPRSRVNFSGDVIIILVDQSDNNPLQHIIMNRSGTITPVDSSLDFDIDKNMLHRAENPYVHDDLIYLLVCIEQIDEKKINHPSKNVQHALKIIQQMQKENFLKKLKLCPSCIQANS